MAKQARRSKAPRRTSLSREGFFEPFHIDDAPWQKLPGSTAFKTLGALRRGFSGRSRAGYPRARTIFESISLSPCRGGTSFHPQGSCHADFGKSQIRLKERHYCCFPAGQRAGHHLYNHTKNACVFLTIGDNKPEDVAIYSNLGKAMIRATRKLVALPDAFVKMRRE